jgi:hypothetical protein
MNEIALGEPLEPFVGHDPARFIVMDQGLGPRVPRTTGEGEGRRRDQNRRPRSDSPVEGLHAGMQSIFHGPNSHRALDVGFCVFRSKAIKLRGVRANHLAPSWR